MLPARPRATGGYRCHWDAEAGVPDSTAGKSVVWDGGRRLRLSKDTEPMISESRTAEVRRQLMAVKPMDTTRTVGLFSDLIVRSHTKMVAGKVITI